MIFIILKLRVKRKRNNVFSLIYKFLGIQSNYILKFFCYHTKSKSAGVAQLVEQLICNQSVMSSSLFTSLFFFT